MAGKRGEGKWQRIGWDQALDEIAAKLAAIRDRYGPEAVLTMGGSYKGAGDAACWRWSSKTLSCASRRKPTTRS